MRGNLIKLALAIAACAATPVLASDEMDKPVQVNTSGLQASVAAQVQKNAHDSLKSLMGYMWFTRKIHHLWLDDVTKAKPEDAVAAGGQRYEARQIATRTTGLR